MNYKHKRTIGLDATDVVTINPGGKFTIKWLPGWGKGKRCRLEITSTTKIIIDRIGEQADNTAHGQTQPKSA